MDQNNIPAEKQNSKEEMHKRVLIVLIILGVFVGIYRFSTLGKTAKPVKSAAVVEKAASYSMPVKNDDKLSKDTSIQGSENEDKDDNKGGSVQADEKMRSAPIPVKTETKNSIIEQKQEEDFSQSDLIRPTNKSEIAKLALVDAGKIDPFAASSGSVSNISNKNYNPRGSHLLPVPPSIGAVPSIGSLPKLTIPGLPGFLPPSIPNQFADNIQIKGFIGNKVIVEVNGVSDSLKVNDRFRGIKVKQVDASGLTAKFEKNGKTIVRSMKSLADIEDKSSVKLVKYNKQS